MSWTDTLPALSPQARQMLAALPQRRVPQGTPLFRAGDTAQGFAVVLLGRVEVSLTGPSGREILLYAVEPGQSCILALNCMFSRLAYPAWVESEGDTEVAIVPGEAFASKLQMDDLKNHVLPGVGFDYRSETGNYQDNCPTCRRRMMTLAQSARVGGFG